MEKKIIQIQGRRQKNFQGCGNGKTRPKYSQLSFPLLY